MEERVVSRGRPRLRRILLACPHSSSDRIFCSALPPGSIAHYPADFDPETYLKGGLGMFGGENPEPIVLRFKKSAVRRVKERIWHPSQEFRKGKEGELVMRLWVEGEPRSGTLSLGFRWRGP